MESNDIPSNAIAMGGDPDLYPPYSKERQDAEIEALRFAFCELTRALHEQGILDLDTVRGGIGNAEWALSSQPRTQESVRWLSEVLAYMRAKLGPMPKRRTGRAGG